MINLKMKLYTKTLNKKLPTVPRLKGAKLHIIIFELS